MNPRNRMNELKRGLAILGISGATVLMGSPVLAQSPTSDRCAAYISGGVGGPIDNQAQVGSSGTPRNRFDQFSGENRNAVLPLRIDTPTAEARGILGSTIELALAGLHQQE